MLGIEDRADSMMRADYFQAVKVQFFELGNKIFIKAVIFSRVV